MQKRKLQSLKDRLKDIERELDALKIFRLTPNLKKFQRALIGEYSFTKNEIAKLTRTKEENSKNKTELIKLANKNRSAKMRRSWNYFRSIQEKYFPDKSLRDLRSAFSRFRRGLETDIPDLVWRNASP